MPGLFDWWSRVRKVVGPPGAPATQAGVPADADAARRAELAPLFDHLDTLEAELRTTESAAAAEAAARRRAADARVETVRADARDRAAIAEADAATARRARFEQESRDAAAKAEQDAAVLLAEARDRMPGLVARAVNSVLTFADAHVRLREDDQRARR